MEFKSHFFSIFEQNLLDMTFENLNGTLSMGPLSYFMIIFSNQSFISSLINLLSTTGLVGLNN